MQFADAPPEMLEASPSFLAMDAPRHAKLRGLVSAAFTPRQVARIEAGIAINATRIIEDAAGAGGRLVVRAQVSSDRARARRAAGLSGAADEGITLSGPQ